jgi:16S rRNA (guanine966-N2)-methyltransferase
MRVVAGSLKGRIFNEPSGHQTHPMSEKVRGALFNALGDIEGLSVLDAFAGSGALSFEAVSRGAKSVVRLIKTRPRFTKVIENKYSGLSWQNKCTYLELMSAVGVSIIWKKI